MESDPRTRRPSSPKGTPKSWLIKKAEARILLTKEKWAHDPDFSDTGCEAYVSQHGELLLLLQHGRSVLYASRQDVVVRQEQLRNLPPSNHILEGLLPQGPHFIEAVPALVDELAITLKIPRNSLDNSFNSLALVEAALAKIRPRKKILGIPSLFAGIIAYTGEVFRQMTGGHWHLHEVPGGIGEPHVHVDDMRYLNPFIEPCKETVESRRGGVMLRPLVSASMRVL